MRIVLLFFAAALMFTACQKQTAETDNIPLIAVGCEDGIKNQDEVDIDCGGSECPPCTAIMTAMVDADTFKANNVTCSLNSNILFLSGTTASPSTTISLQFNGTPTVGTFSNVQALYSNSSGKQYTTQNATLTFTDVNFVNNAIEGAFNFSAVNFTTPLDTVIVTNGIFKRISF